MRGTDVLHVHNLGSFANLCAIAVKEGRTPLILKADFSESAYRRLVHHPIRLAYVKSAIAHADIVQALSNYEKELLLSLGVEESKIVVIPPGLELSRYRRRAKEAASLRVGYFGRIGHGKGLREVLPSLLHILEKNPRLQLSIAGQALTRSDSRWLARGLRGQGRARYVGPISPPEDFLSQIDILVAPSFAESAAIGVLEAMATGAVVVARRNSIHCEYIKHGVNGLLFQTTEEFQEAMEAVVSDEAFRGQLAHRAVEFVRRYDVQRITSEMEDAYRRALQERGRE